MRNLTAITCLLLVSSLIGGCEPTPVGLGVNVKISPAWGDSIESVVLIFCGRTEAACACDNIASDGWLLANWVDCSTWAPLQPPPGAYCIESQEVLSTEPVDEGVVRHVPVGNHTIVGFGLSDSGLALSHDCEAYTIREGEFTDVTIDL